jgi:uncharacterized protein YebE (UPF0316 family)
MSTVLIALGIFGLRILDVSIGTVRVIYTIRGQRLLSAILGVVESGIWIVAISSALKYAQSSRLSMVAWALGFATGTVVGISLEQWIGTGWVMMRAISQHKAGELRDTLLGRGFGVTTVNGEGRSGRVLILFVVAPRKRGKEMLAAVQSIDEDAFITIEPLSQAIGGYVPRMAAAPSAMRK